MKKLENRLIKQLIEIIPNHPALRVLQFTDGGEQFSNILSEFCLSQEYEYQLNVLDEIFYQKAIELYGNNMLSSVKLIKWEQRRYTSHAKLYDFIFVTANVPKNHREFFSKTVHSHIKNAGHIILFLEKNNQQNLEEWYNILEENLFVAINNIDLFKNYDTLIAKKMHGWGK